MVENLSKSESTGKKSRPLDVIEWTNINLSKWLEWGFDVDRVFRTSQYHMVFQRMKPTLVEVSDPEPALELGGSWYLVDLAMEKKLEKMIWIAWFTAAMIFALALIALGIGMNYLSLILFVGMYVIVEGFLPLSLKKLADDKKESNIRIKITSLMKVIHFVKSGNILLSWSKDNTNTGVAFRLDHNVAEALISRIRDHAPENAEIKTEIDSNPLAPSAKKAEKR